MVCNDKYDDDHDIYHLAFSLRLKIASSLVKGTDYEL